MLCREAHEEEPHDSHQYGQERNDVPLCGERAQVREGTQKKSNGRGNQQTGFLDSARAASCGLLLEPQDKWTLNCRMFRTISVQVVTLPESVTILLEAL